MSVLVTYVPRQYSCTYSNREALFVRTRDLGTPFLQQRTDYWRRMWYRLHNFTMFLFLYDVIRFRPSVTPRKTDRGRGVSSLFTSVISYLTYESTIMVEVQGLMKKGLWETESSDGYVNRQNFLHIFLPFFENSYFVYQNWIYESILFLFFLFRFKSSFVP